MIYFPNMSQVLQENIVILYHANCWDGFGAAWVARRKFGDRASYIPCLHVNVDIYPEGVIDKEVYVIDFCFSEKITKELQERNKKFVVIDHHKTVQSLVETLPEHVFSLTDSGAKLAWKYFHPETAVPKLIEYISDGDIWAHALPNWKEIEGYIHSQELSFESFDTLHETLEHHFDEAIKIGKILNTQFDNLVKEHIDKAMLVEFEGYEVYACNASSFLRSELGHQLALKKGPFSIVYRFEEDILRISLRGDGSIDLTVLAEKYGGGGHKDASAIIMKHKNPLPFRKL